VRHIKAVHPQRRRTIYSGGWLTWASRGCQVKRVISAREFKSRISTAADQSRGVWPQAACRLSRLWCNFLTLTVTVQEITQIRYSFLHNHQAFVVIKHMSPLVTPVWSLRRQAEGGLKEFPGFIDVGEPLADEESLLRLPEPPPTTVPPTAMP
jgi:hypothetical protein